MSNPYFADLSNNNERFNAPSYADAGHLLIALKATEGVSFIDPDHRTWALHAGLSHLGVIHYHFARPDLATNPRVEAEHFLRTVQGLTGARDYLVLDLERGTPQGWQHDPAWAQGFDAFIRDHSRFHTILYASRSVLQQSDKWLVSDPKRVWDADYSTTPDYAPPGYWVAFRQFTDGVVGPDPHVFAGVGNCDGNRMSRKMYQQVLANAHRQPC